MKDDIRKQLVSLLGKHVQVLEKKMVEHEDLNFILEVLDSLLGKIDENELESLLTIDEKELKDLEHLFKDESEKNLIHKVSGIRYLIAGIHDKHVKIDITKEQKQIIMKFLKLLQEKKNIILPVLSHDKSTLEQDKSKQLLEKLENLNTHTYLSELEELKKMFSEFELPFNEQYHILYSVLEHNQSVYTSLKEAMS